MKKLVVLTMAVALFIGIPFCVFAQEGPEEPRDVSKWCKQIAAEFPAEFAGLFKNDLGQCVSSLQVCWEHGNTPAVCFCRQFKIAYPDEYEAFFATKGLGQCVTHWGAPS